MKLEHELTVELRFLEEKLDNESNVEENVKISNHIKENQAKLEDINKKKTEGIMLRSKAKWHEDGEKPSKYFLSLEKRKFLNKAITRLETSTKKEVTKKEDLLDEIKSYYSKLYTSKDTIDVDLDKLFENCQIPKLATQEANSLEGKLQHDELLNALKNMKNEKSPGPSGYTTEFYKFFWRDLNKYLIKSLNLAYKRGELSISQKQGLITSIPKNDKPKHLLKNYRPISLLNVSYKIASAAIAGRIKTILDKIISEDQKGFMKGRYIGECTRLVADLMDYTEFMNIPGLLIMIDFEKAFDSVEWSFIQKCLDFYQFGPSVKQWISTFYNNIQSSALMNGFSSVFFSYYERMSTGRPPFAVYIFDLCRDFSTHAPSI